MKKKNWEEVGVVNVDAGLIWIGDPCYVLHEVHKRDSKIESLSEPQPKKKEIGEDWLGFCRNLWNKQEKDLAPAVQFNHDAGHPGLGVCCQSGYGDGSYPVYIRYNKEGVVAELKVVFDDED